MDADRGLPFVDLHAQYRSIKDEVSTAITTVLERGDFILGHDVAEFEREFADYCGTRHAVGVDSGLSALELGLRALGVGPGDEVIVPANSFIASALPITALGAKAVLVDVDEDTYNLDVTLVEAAITPRTKAIMPVHLYGRLADMAAIMELAERHGLKVIEDACQAHGARSSLAGVSGRAAGGFGHVAAFSFYPAKNLGAYGDGGALTTDDDEIAERVRLLRNYGSKVKYHHEVAGYNRRLDTLHAAVLRVKLRYLDAWNAARQRHAVAYREALAGSDLILPSPAPEGEHVYHLYVVRCRERDELQAHLSALGIATGIHYPIPIHLQPAYRDLGHSPGDFPITERLAAEILSLPMFAELPASAPARVAAAIASHRVRTKSSGHSHEPQRVPASLE